MRTFAIGRFRIVRDRLKDLTEMAKMTKWEIASLLDQVHRQVGIYWDMPIHTYCDTYTRKELVDLFNHFVERHYLPYDAIV